MTNNGKEILSASLWLLLAVVLFAAHNHADYLLQAYQHGWNTWLDLHGRAPKWGLWDFIPHDAWHIVQSVRNQSLFVAIPVAWVAAANLAMQWTKGNAYWPMVADKYGRFHAWPGIVIGLLLYAATRAAAFTLVYEILN
jgi:hypothetical protein